MIARLTNALLDLLYPPKANCMGCGSPLGADDNWLCSECAEMLNAYRAKEVHHCALCGRPKMSSYCAFCADWPIEGLSAARFCYPYGSPAGGMIRRFKYRGAYRMAEWMANEMAGLLPEYAHFEPDILVPVPMHRLRERTRGFNQSALLAKELSTATGIPIEPALSRVRNTKQQAKLNAAARRKNLNGAFHVEYDVEELRVLLVDDVLTTGTTANECAKALREAGAVDVKLITFAGAE